MESNAERRLFRARFSELHRRWIKDPLKCSIPNSESEFQRFSGRALKVNLNDESSFPSLSLNLKTFEIRNRPLASLYGLDAANKVCFRARPEFVIVPAMLLNRDRQEPPLRFQSNRNDSAVLLIYQQICFEPDCFGSGVQSLNSEYQSSSSEPIRSSEMLSESCITDGSLVWWPPAVEERFRRLHSISDRPMTIDPALFRWKAACNQNLFELLTNPNLNFNLKQRLCWLSSKIF